MNNLPTFASSTSAVSFLESASYGDSVMIKGDLLRVTKWNHDHIVLTRNGDLKQFRYNFKSC